MQATITGDSPEAVAYALMLDVLSATGRASAEGRPSVTEAEMLNVFARCLLAAKGARVVVQDIRLKDFSAGDDAG